MSSSQGLSGTSSPSQKSQQSFLGKRHSSETSESEAASEISRLNERNSKLKQQLSDSQEEVKRLTAVIEQHAIHKKSKTDDKSQTRYWSDEEHQKFLDALQAVGPKDVKAISNLVGTRSATQVRTHAQKYFIKLARIKKNAEDAVQAGTEGAEQEAWWLQGIDSSSSSSGSTNKSEKKDGKRRGLPAGLEGMDSTSMQALADIVGSAPVQGGGGASKRRAEASEEGRQDRERGGGKGAAGHKAGLPPSGFGLKKLEGAAGREKGMNLTSSSNEESGATDGSSTHGNGSNGSWNESGSNPSLNNSDGSNGSSNGSSNVSDCSKAASANTSDRGSNGSDGSNNSDRGSNHSDGGSNHSDGGSERGAEREGSSERDGGEEAREEEPEART